MTSYFAVIESQNRDPLLFAKPNDYSIQLPRVYKNVTAVRLNQARIPYSVHPYSSDYQTNVFAYSLNGNSAIASVQNGYYSAATIATALKSSIDSTLADGNVVISHNATTGRLTFAFTGLTSITSLAVSSTGDDMTALLGFPKGTTTYSVSGGAVTVVTPNAMSVNSQSFMYLDMEDLNHMHVAGINRTEKASIAALPVPSTGFGSVVQLSEEQELRGSMKTLKQPIAKLDRIHVAFRDSRGRILNFNGLDHGLVLEICADF